MRIFSNLLSRWITTHVIVFLATSFLLSFIILTTIISYQIEGLNEERCISRKEHIESLLSKKHDKLSNEVNRLSTNNTIRVNLMLGMQSQSAEKIRKLFYSHDGLSYFVIDKNAEVYSSTKYADQEEMNAVLDIIKNKPVTSDYRFYNVHDEYHWISYQPITHRDKILGTAIVLYDFKKDNELVSYLKGTNDHIVLTVDNNEVCLLSMDVTMNSLKSHKVYGFKYNKTVKIYLSDRLSDIKTIIMISILILTITIILSSLPFTLFIYKKVNTPLEHLVSECERLLTNPNSQFDFNITTFKEFDIVGKSFIRLVDWLKSSEQRYKFIVENMEESLWMLNMDLEYTYASPSVERITGYTVDEIFTKGGVDLINIDDQHALLEIYLEKMEKKDYSKLTTIVKQRHKDGFEFWAELSMSFILDSNNVPIGIQGITRDITDKVLAEINLKEREEQYSNIFNKVQTGILIIDSETFLIEAANPAALQILGYKKEEIINKVCTDMVCVHNEGTCPIMHRGMDVSDRVCEMLTKNGYRNCLKTVVKVEIGGKVKLLESFIDITEQEQIKEQLIQSENKYRSLYEDIQIGIFRTKTYGKESIWKDVNSSMVKILGCKRSDELIGTSTLGFWIDSKDRNRLLTLLADSDESQVTEYKARIKAKTNQIKEVMISARFKNNIMEGTCIDITKQVYQEQQIKQSEQKFRMITENASDIIWILDLNMKFQYLSPSIETILGFTVEEGLSRQFKNVTTPESYTQVKDIITKVKNGAVIQEPVHFELQGYTKAGESKWLQISASSIRDIDKKVIGFQGVTRDIDKQKIATDALEYSERRYRTFVENFHGIVFQALVGTKPVFFHGAVKEITGWTEQEMINSEVTWQRLIHPDDRERVLLGTDKLKTQRGYHEERKYRIIKKDGSLIWIRENIHNIYEDGKCKYLQGVITDYTDQKSMEEALQHSNKMSYLGIMAAGIAHEINNPLTGIIQYGEILQEEFEDDEDLENHEMMCDIIENSIRIRDIIKQLLSYSRKGGKITPRNIIDVIDNSIKHSTNRLERYNVVLNFNHPDSCLVVCDQNLIQQIFINLINNAVDAIDSNQNQSGNRIINITITIIDAETIITFRDNGTGMTKNELNHIFDPFFTTKDPGKGTGLGMSLVQNFIEDNKGKISVDSIKGNWTEFTIKFPTYIG